jgi:hypothetical protein
MNLDHHYTPVELARIAIKHVRMRHPKIIADVAAGEGSLLLEAARRWPSARIVATDIDRGTVTRLLRARRHRWKVGRCDFLAPDSRSASGALRNVQGRVNLLLLNPPFSCRGGSYRIVDLVDGPLRASMAMAFVLVGLEYLSGKGQAVVILPAGSLYNKKDEAAWTYVRRRFAVQELAHWDKNAFPGCAASSVLVKLTPHGSADRSVFPSRRRLRGKRARKPRVSAVIVRGTCPIHEIPKNATGPTLVHYTDLRDAGVVLNGHRGNGTHRCVAGPAVLIPRVGRITPEKVAVFTSTRRVMISDCVIGLKTQSAKTARRLRKLLVDNFRVLAKEYLGTGAPHITLERLRDAMSRVGVAERS